MNSKLELRIESVKIAVNVEGVTSENVIETAEKIEKYIAGSVNFPEVYDPNAQTTELAKVMFGQYFNKPVVSDEKVVEETEVKEVVTE